MVRVGVRTAEATEHYFIRLFDALEALDADVEAQG